MKVLIAGCGDLGTEIGLRLVAAGHQVVGLRRNADVLPASFTRISGDLNGPLPPLPDDVEGLVYAAAADGRSEHAYRTAYLDGPQRVLDALAAVAAVASRTVFVSSTAVYGVTDGSDVDEATPTEPRTATGQVLLDAEGALLERQGGTAVVLRLAGIYGPGRTRLIDQVRSGEAVIPDPPVHTNRIHRDDAAAAAVHLLTAVDRPERVYLGVDHAPAERGEVLRWLAAELGVPEPPSGPVQRTRGGDKRCRNQRLVGTGFSFAYRTYVEGYRALLAGRGARHP